jgi:hypothetical protein
MWRRLSRCALVVFAALLAAVAVHAREERQLPEVLQRFWALPDPPPVTYRALRHLQATNGRYDKSAWMDVWAEVTPHDGFRYTIASEGGSPYIRNKVFRGTLERERKAWASGAPDRAALTLENYQFANAVRQPDGLESVAVTPRREDMLLIDGSIFLRPADGELMRVEGELSKNPSFWTRHVHIVRRYGRFAGVRLPVELVTQAKVVFAGESSFRMTYEYASVNGEHLANPQARHAADR